MPVVRHLYDDGFDHRQIGGHRHAIVEEARIIELAVAGEDALLVERPADALHDAALDLPLHIAGMDGPPGILNRRVAYHLHLAGLPIDLDIADVRGEPAGRAVRVERATRVDRAARGARAGGQLRQCQWRELARIGAGRTGLAVLPNDRLYVDLPKLRRALTQGLDHLLGCFGDHHGGGERDA